MKTRTIKISYIVTKGKRFQCERKETIKPKILLSGDWLKFAGFNIGEMIKIEIENNKLILTTKTP